VIRQREPIKRTAIKRRPPRVRRDLNPRYLDWLRQQRCMLASAHCNGAIEAAHVGDRGLGQKCADREAVPLCAAHHRTGPGAHHVLGKKFWMFHGLHRDAVVLAYNAGFMSETGEEL